MENTTIQNPYVETLLDILLALDTDTDKHSEDVRASSLLKTLPSPNTNLHPQNVIATQTWSLSPHNVYSLSILCQSHLLRT